MFLYIYMSFSSLKNFATLLPSDCYGFYFHTRVTILTALTFMNHKHSSYSIMLHYTYEKGLPSTRTEGRYVFRIEYPYVLDGQLWSLVVTELFIVNRLKIISLWCQQYSSHYLCTDMQSFKVNAHERITYLELILLTEIIFVAFHGYEINMQIYIYMYIE